MRKEKHTMILADKIISLRKKAGWSQEELAEQLGVTRQSVSKWEGAQSVPDMDKVVQMSRLFGVTTDFLLKDEIEEQAAAPAEEESVLRRVTMAQAADYLARRKAAAPKVALAVLLCVISPVTLLLLAAMSEVQRFPISENAAAGIGLCVLAAAPLFAAVCIDGSGLLYVAAVGALLVLVGIGCLFLVNAGVYSGAMERLLEEGDYTRGQKKHNKVLSTVTTIYWPAATAVFLIYTYGPSGNGQPRYSWVIWAVAGVLYAAVMGVVRLLLRSRKDQ